MAEAGERYSKLTIGDGLVSQIPALFVSTAAAVLVTKSSSRNSLGYNVLSQVGGRPRATLIAAGMLFAIGLLPGMPRLPFFVLATVLLVTWRATRGMEAELEEAGAADAEGRPAVPQAAAEPAEGAPRESESVEELLRVDRLCLEIGYRLIPLVQDGSGAGILDHIAQLRRRFATREGLVLPPVRIKDNIRLRAQRLPHPGRRPGGRAAARSSRAAGWRWTAAAASGQAQGQADHRPRLRPAGDLDRRDPARRGRAARLHGDRPDQRAGHAPLGGHPHVDRRDRSRATTSRSWSRPRARARRPSSQELIPERIGYGEIQAVLRNLLREGVPIRNMPVILETIADHVAAHARPRGADRARAPAAGARAVRAARRQERHALRGHARPGHRGAPGRGGRRQARPRGRAGQPGLAAAAGRAHRRARSPRPPAAARTSCCWCARTCGASWASCVRASLPKVAVLSYNEVVPARAIETLSTVKLEEQ